MYIHLGQETVIDDKEIIGIFDLDTSTVSKKTREFLANAEKKQEVINITNELPKSFIVCSSGEEKNKVYLSQISTSTLLKRTQDLPLLNIGKHMNISFQILILNGHFLLLEKQSRRQKNIRGVGESR